MKTNIWNQKRRGFSLIELITVIAIIVILVGLTISVLSSGQAKAGIEQTKGQLAFIESSLAQYYEEYGEYPPSFDSGGSKGAKVLYQALTGDGNSLLVESGGTSSNGVIDSTEAKENKSWVDPENDPQGLVGKDRDKDYVLRDAFGNAWQYRSYDKGNPSGTNNSTYDLWSFSIDKEQSKEVKWIKNW